MQSNKELNIYIYIHCQTCLPRRSFTKLHTSSHRLQIELGRYHGVPRHNRICTKCSSNVIEDELHFLFECSKYDEDRESMLFEITTVCSNLRNLNSQNKLIWLFVKILN